MLKTGPRLVALRSEGLLDLEQIALGPSQLPRASGNMSQHAPGLSPPWELMQANVPGSHPSHRTDSFAGRRGEPGLAESEGIVLFRVVGLESNRKVGRFFWCKTLFGESGCFRE